jgi:hypothetical protein
MSGSAYFDSPALDGALQVAAQNVGSSADKSEQMHSAVRAAFVNIISQLQETASTLNGNEADFNLLHAKLVKVHDAVARKRSHEPHRLLRGDVATHATGLHPIMLTLVLAVVDIYTHRSHQNGFFERARAMIRAKCTTGIAGIALELRIAFQKSMVGASQTLMRRVDTEFLSQHQEQWDQIRAAVKRVNGRPPRENATLDQFLEDAAAAATRGFGIQGRVKVKEALPSNMMVGIVEPLPWIRLQKRLSLWKMQLQQCRRVLQSSAGGDGVTLSKALAEGQRKCLAAAAALPSEETISEDDVVGIISSWSNLASNALPDELGQASTMEEEENDLSLAAALLAKLHEQRAQARQALDQLLQRMAVRVQETFEAEVGALQRAEAEALSTLGMTQHTFLRGSLNGERAINRELKQACNGSEFSWRSVQRLMQTVVSSYQAGTKASAMRLLAEEAMELKSFVARAKSVIVKSGKSNTRGGI